MSDIVLSSKDYVDNNAGGSKFISDSDNTLRLGAGKDDTYANDIEIGGNPSAYVNGPAILVEHNEVKIFGSTFRVGPDYLTTNGFISSKYIRENNAAIELGLHDHSIYISGPIVPNNTNTIQLGTSDSTHAITFEINGVTLTLDSVKLQKLKQLLES